MKVCTGCKREMPLTAFGRLSQDDPDVLMAAVGYLIQYAAFEGGFR